MKKTLLVWSRCDDVWKRRSAIIAQVAFKRETDPDLLARFIAPSISRKEFWLRKAIGWALRAYAWHEPRWVVRYVNAHKDELSPLSVREALKNV
jgi:3-methyladenine DNA glycosylase AlkD